MKILVVQLARLGDLYMTAPILKALRRQNPNAEIHLLARKSFASAIESVPSVHELNVVFQSLDVREILSPLISEKPDLDRTFENVSHCVEKLKEQNYDRVINLSFSPLSSYLVHALQVRDTSGYSRHSDGFLAIEGDASCYFYAQVGPTSRNRVHLFDLMAQVSGVEPNAEDFNFASPSFVRDERIVFHLGASETTKTFSSEKWFQIIKYVAARFSGQVYLVGTKSEKESLSSVFASGLPENVVNAMGKTSLADLVSLIGSSKLLVGGDSAPVHVSTLVQTPVVNFSLPTVNFFETGPKTDGSRIFKITDEAQFGSDQLGEECLSCYFKRPAKLPCWEASGPISQYQPTFNPGEDICWEMLQSVYMGRSFPVVSLANRGFYLGVQHLYQANQIALQQLQRLEIVENDAEAAQILTALDEVLEKVSHLVPELAVVIRWMQTEKVRLGPNSIRNLLRSTREIHEKFGEILKIYVIENQTEVKNANSNVG